MLNFDRANQVAYCENCAVSAGTLEIVAGPIGAHRGASVVIDIAKYLRIIVTICTRRSCTPSSHMYSLRRIQFHFLGSALVDATVQLSALRQLVSNVGLSLRFGDTRFRCRKTVAGKKIWSLPVQRRATSSWLKGTRMTPLVSAYASDTAR